MIVLVWNMATGKDQRFELEDGEYRLGRSPDSHVQIPSPRVSRKHAQLRVEGTQLFVTDLGGTNGTEVDGLRISPEKGEIECEAVINVADVVLLREGAELPRVSPRTMELKVDYTEEEDITSVEAYDTREEMSETARGRLVGILSELFELVSKDVPGEQLAKEACQFVSQVVQADRVGILVDDGPGTPLRVQAFWTSGPESDDGVKLSKHLIDQVFQDKKTLLVEDAQQDPRFYDQKSVLDLQIRSAILAPLFDNERVRGLLYVDTLIRRARYSLEDLQVLAAIANAVAIRKRQSEHSKELQLAGRIQENMLPAEIPEVDGYDLNAWLEVSRGVGGDFYECLSRPNGNLLLAVGDVAGKGIPAALSMAAATVLIRLLARVGGAPDDILRELHEQLRVVFAPDQFITILIGELDPKTNTLVYASAGHEPAQLLRADGSNESLSSTGLLIGHFDQLPLSRKEVAMEPGDLLAIYTDGIPEATQMGDEFFGHEAALRIFTEHSGDDLNEIYDVLRKEIQAFLRGASNSDDITLILLRRQT